MGIYFAVTILYLLPLVHALPATLELKRVSPEGIPLSQLRAGDQLRHQHIGVIDFPLLSSPNVSSLGFYMTRVKIGSPPKEFNLIVDTASHISWVSCTPCSGCPTSNKLGVQLGFYDPHNSTSVSKIFCPSQTCKRIVHPHSCSSQSLACYYSIGYLDKSLTTGYLISDIFHLYTVLADSETKNVQASITFGCTNHRSESLNEAHKAYDGILALGQHDNSFISQLSAQGMIPNIFSHCFRGGLGGGILVLGEILEPSMVYTPLVTSQGPYDINMQSIAVNGKIIPIDRAVFASKNGGGTIIDSGTTLAVLAEKAYDPFIHSINAVASQYSRPVHIDGDQCFQLSNRIEDVFPIVSLNFEGGASMILKPKDYLVWINHFEGNETWCIGFQKMEGQSVTILGDLVLKDKIVVYDLARGRLGWADYNCSQTVNVSTTPRSASSLTANSLLKSVVTGILAVTSILALFIYLCMFG